VQFNPCNPCCSKKICNLKVTLISNYPGNATWALSESSVKISWVNGTHLLTQGVVGAWNGGISGVGGFVPIVTHDFQVERSSDDKYLVKTNTPCHDPFNGIVTISCDSNVNVYLNFNSPEKAVLTCLCACAPKTLTMTVVSGCDDTLNSCTFTYGPTPSVYSGLNALGPFSYLSDQVFTDIFGDNYRHVLICSQGQLAVTRVYATSIFGSPMMDTTRYFWNVQSPNTCYPFSFTSGHQPFNPSCIVTLSG
jgi:hypothetical protein